MNKIKWYELKDTGDFEKADFSYPLPDGFLSSSFLTCEMESARKLIIEELKIKPELGAWIEKIGKNWQNVIVIWEKKELSDLEKFEQIYNELFQEKDTVYTHAQKTLDCLCNVALAINTNRNEKLLDAVYLFACTYERLLIKSKQSDKNSKAGKQSAKVRAKAKEEAYALWQKLELHKYNIEYIKRNLLPLAQKYGRSDSIVSFWVSEFKKADANKQC